MFDIIISGGTVVDGTGSPGIRADVGINGERIESISDLSQAGARRVIDATGLTGSPGFIDSHAHSDGVLLWDPQHANGIRQGVTTEILGQDGLSYAPLSPDNYRTYRRYLSGILGEPPEDLDMSSVEAFRSHYHKKVAINTAYNVAHGAIRLETLGFTDKPLVGDALEEAKRLVREGMEQGAVGFATGMSYHPNAWSDTAELVELCKVVAKFGGVYATHLRDVNTARGFGGGQVPEALEIGRQSGVKVHFSHYRTQASNAGQVAERMELIDKAKAEGVDCTLELYPYPTGSSFPLSFLPSYAHEGGPDANGAATIDTGGLVNRNLSQREFVASYGNRLDAQGRAIKDLQQAQLPRPEIEQELAALRSENAQMRSDGQAAIDAISAENANLRSQLSEAAKAPAAAPPVPPPLTTALIASRMITR